MELCFRVQKPTTPPGGTGPVEVQIADTGDAQVNLLPLTAGSNEEPAAAAIRELFREHDGTKATMTQVLVADPVDSNGDGVTSAQEREVSEAGGGSYTGTVYAAQKVSAEAAREISVAMSADEELVNYSRTLVGGAMLVISDQGLPQEWVDDCYAR